MTSLTDDPKKLAKRLRDDLAGAGFAISHSLALELVAHQAGDKDWNTLAAATKRRIGSGVPVLRVMSLDLALPFYTGYLGFRLDWTHRFGPDSPGYAQVSRSQAVLHLSEHHGDGSPNGVVWFPVADVHHLRRELHARPDAPMRPGVDTGAPGGPTLEVIDPYGNVLRFAEVPHG